MYNKIKKIILFIFILLFMCKSHHVQTDIFGIWEGVYGNEKVAISFKRDSSCTINYYDSTTHVLKVLNGIYHLDITKKNIPLSISGIDQLEYSLYTIIDFINNDSLILAYFSPKWRLRPISFNKDKILCLKRVSSKNN